MQSNSLFPSLQFKIPEPFREMKFQLFQHGIYDNETIDVMMSDDQSFACLSPQPIEDYKNYIPRARKLNLAQYKKRMQTLERRYQKIATFMPQLGNILEIGASDGSFLDMVHQHRPELHFSSLEPDLNSAEHRRALTWLHQYFDFEEIQGQKLDIIMFFHVLEHIIDPGPFLKNCFKILSSQGRLIIEVPSLEDPLLSLYASKAYSKFYFQKQHPYIYSSRSLRKLIEYYGGKVEKVIPYQRYGLENHLTWLAQGRPGGEAQLAALLENCEASYIESIEKSGLTDTVIVVVSRL